MCSPACFDPRLLEQPPAKLRAVLAHAHASHAAASFAADAEAAGRALCGPLHPDAAAAPVLAWLQRLRAPRLAELATLAMDAVRHDRLLCWQALSGACHASSAARGLLDLVVSCAVERTRLAPGFGGPVLREILRGYPFMFGPALLPHLTQALEDDEQGLAALLLEKLEHLAEAEPLALAAALAAAGRAPTGFFGRLCALHPSVCPDAEVRKALRRAAKLHAAEVVACRWNQPMARALAEMGRVTEAARPELYARLLDREREAAVLVFPDDDPRVLHLSFADVLFHATSMAVAHGT